MRFADLFPLSVRIVAARKGKNPDELIKHVKTFGHRLRAGPPGVTPYIYHVYGTIMVTVPECLACPALKDKPCSLHPDKPLACSTAPFAGGVPQRLQQAAYKRWADWECIDHKDGEMIFDGKKITNTGYLRHYKQTYNAIKLDQKLFAAFWPQIPKDVLPDILEMATTQHSLLPFAEMLPILRDSGRYDDVTLKRLITSQNRLLEGLAQKVPDEPVRGPIHWHMQLALKRWQAQL